jgi:hypothetical protein
MAMDCMKLIRNLGILSLLSVLALDAQATTRANGEYSTSPPAPVLQWRIPTAAPAQPPAVVRYPEITVRRIHAVSQKNGQAGQMAQQLGIGRIAAHEGAQPSPAALNWRIVPGGSVARVEYTSPLALAMRVGLRVDLLHPGVELRFAGSENPGKVVASMTVAQMQRLAGPGGVFWTPSTDGQTQLIEIYRPRNVPAVAAWPRAPMVSHLFNNSGNSFTLSKALGDADTCQIDTTCKLETLGPDFAKAVAATGMLQYVDLATGNTYGCTITLVTDKAGNSQIPYAISGQPCSTTSLSENPGSANTFWGYESTACKSGVARQRVQLTSGITVLAGAAMADVAGSGVLLRLNEPAPAGTAFSGWDTAPLPPQATIHSIHHTRGDVKKVVSGVFRGTSTYTHNVGWVGGGYMEPLSWGAGLFTADADGYHLRGVARNGALICSQTYTLGSPGNTQNYGRLDLLYPFIRQWLAPGELAPMPDFDYVANGRTLTFNVNAENNWYSVSWRFSDTGMTAENSLPEHKTHTHTFGAPGYYTVTMFVKSELPTPREYAVTHVVPVEQPVRVNGSQPLVPPAR